MADAQARVERVLDARPIIVHARTTTTTASPGGTIAHQAST